MKYRILSSELSGTIGYPRIKANLVGHVFGSNAMVGTAVTKKIGNQDTTIYKFNYDNKVIAFCESEIQIIPDKPPTPKKDKTIRIGSIVKVVNTKKNNLIKDKEYEVKLISNIGRHRFATLVEEGKQYKVLIKNLKKIKDGN